MFGLAPEILLDSTWPKLRHLRRRRACDNPRFFIFARNMQILHNGARPTGRVWCPFFGTGPTEGKKKEICFGRNYVTGMDLAHGRMRYEIDIREKKG